MSSSTAFDLSSLSLGSLLTIHAGIGGELKRRNISRTGNNPCADFAEILVSQTFKWKLNPNSKAGFDACTPEGQRIEIKARRLGRANASRQASAIRKIDSKPFDRLVGVVFAADYSVLLGVDVPYEVVVERSSHVSHTNSARFYLRDDLVSAPGVKDITKALKRTAERLLAAQ